MGGESADVIGVQMRDQNQVNQIRGIARTAQTVPQASERWPAPPRAGARVDQDHLLAGVHQKARIGDVQQVRILAQRFRDAVDCRLLCVQPVQIECTRAIV